jgi:hypothetical protein
MKDDCRDKFLFSNLDELEPDASRADGRSDKDYCSTLPRLIEPGIKWDLTRIYDQILLGGYLPRDYAKTILWSISNGVVAMSRGMSGLFNIF